MKAADGTPIAELQADAKAERKKYEALKRDRDSWKSTVESIALMAGMVASETWGVLDILTHVRVLREERDALKAENARISKELDKGDSWVWIRRKFEAHGVKFRWYSPRTDSLVGTRYEVMGWLHCLFADADPNVFIDIALEHQKRTDEAEAENAALKATVERLSALVSEKKDIWFNEWRPIINAIGEISVQEAMDAIERDL